MEHLRKISEFKNDLESVKRVIYDLQELIKEDIGYGSALIFKDNLTESLEVRTGINDYFLIKFDKIEESNFRYYIFNAYKNNDSINIEIENGAFKIVYDKMVYASLKFYFENGTLQLKSEDNKVSYSIIDELFKALYNPKVKNSIGFAKS